MIIDYAWLEAHPRLKYWVREVCLLVCGLLAVLAVPWAFFLLARLAGLVPGWR
jgi:hypothetical protein